MRIGNGGFAIGLSRGGGGTGGSCCGRCAGGGTEVSFVTMLVGMLAALGVKLTPVATGESRLSVVVYYVQEWPSLW